MKKKKTLLKILFFAALICMMFPIPVLAAQKYSTIGNSYIKVGSKKTKLQMTAYNYEGKLIYQASGKTKTINSHAVSAVSDGSKVYYTVRKSKKLYCWNSKTAKTSTYGTLPAYTGYGTIPYIKLVCGYGKYLYFTTYTGMLEGDTGVYRYSLSAKKSSVVRKQACTHAYKGKYLIVEGSRSQPCPVPIFVYDMAASKLKRITKSAFPGSIFGNKYYYAEKVSGSGTWKVRIKSHQLSNSKYSTLTGTFSTYSVTITSAHSATYYDPNYRRNREISF